MYRNIGLFRFKTANTDNFTSNIGIKIRRLINRPMRTALKLATNGKIIIESYPELPKGKPYIFCSTHSFVEEITATFSTIDRSAYSLMGTTDQLEHNPKIYALWLMGMIYVDRNNEFSRKDSLKKMKRILNSGSSVLIFPEGGWNNTENLLCMKLFASPYYLSQETNVPIVPIAAFNEFNSKNIYIRVGEPISDIGTMKKKEALATIRDSMATMMYNMIESHSTPIEMAKLECDPRMAFMNERRLEYLKTKWTYDAWEEELTEYMDKNHPTPKEVRKTYDNICITPQNANILAPILSRRAEDIRYDFKKYMHENWREK